MHGPFLSASRCSNCGVGEEQALLAARLRYVGGIGNVCVVECRDQRDCWRRRDAKEKAASADTLAA